MLGTKLIESSKVFGNVDAIAKHINPYGFPFSKEVAAVVHSLVVEINDCLETLSLQLQKGVASDNSEAIDEDEYWHPPAKQTPVDLSKLDKFHHGKYCVVENVRGLLEKCNVSMVEEGGRFKMGSY